MNFLNFVLEQCEDSKSIGNLTIAINLVTVSIEAHLLRSARQERITRKAKNDPFVMSLCQRIPMNSDGLSSILNKGYPEGCVDSIGMLLYSLENLKGFFMEKCGKDYSKVKCKKYVPNVKHCVSFLTLSKMSQEFEKIKSGKETNLRRVSKLMF